MKRAIFTILFVIPFLISCSQEDGATRNTLSSSGGYADADEVVQSADGSLYSIGCLQSSAYAIKQHGAVAMQECQVSVSSGAIETESVSRGKFFSNTYANVYYPPTYYKPSYSSYNYGSNSSSYNCYNDNRFKNDVFCGFVFGANSGINCYYALGFNNSNYNQYKSSYNSSCSSCVYSGNPTQCQNRCYNQMPVSYY